MSYSMLFSVIAGSTAVLSLTIGTQRRIAWEMYLPMIVSSLVLLAHLCALCGG